MELVGIPDPETFCQLPWDKRVARVYCVCFRNREEREDPGTFLTSDCRGNLKRIHEAFKEKYGLPFTLVADPETKLIEAFGVPARGRFASRQTFLVVDGKIAWRDLKATPKTQADEALAALQSLGR